MKRLALAVALAIVIMLGREERAQADHYFEVRLLPAQHEALETLLEGGSLAPAEKRDLLTTVRGARRFDLPPTAIDWDAAERRARNRGESVADLIWDEGKMREPG